MSSFSMNERKIVTNVNIQNAGYSVVLPADKIISLLTEAELNSKK